MINTIVNILNWYSCYSYLCLFLHFYIYWFFERKKKEMEITIILLTRAWRCKNTQKKKKTKTNKQKISYNWNSSCNHDSVCRRTDELVSSSWSKTDWLASDPCCFCTLDNAACRRTLCSSWNFCSLLTPC